MVFIVSTDNVTVIRHIVITMWLFKFSLSPLFLVLASFSLTDTAMLISELTRFTVSTFFSTELLVFLECWPTGKEFRLPWRSFVRVEIYFKYRLSINMKYRLPNREPFIAKWLERLPEELGVVSSSPGLFIFLIKVYIFYFLVFLFLLLFPCPFYLSQYGSKTMCEYIESTTTPDL